jgi:hypothetical protein
VNDDELDLDGDGIADVIVPGLGARVEPTSELLSTSPYEAVAQAEMPPESSPYSPMGQIDHLGYALRSQTARAGWRRRVIVGTAIFMIAVLGVAIVASLVASVR